MQQPAQHTTSLRAAQRTPSAFTAFYRERAHGLLVFFVRRTFDLEVAKDLTAETFAQAFEHRASFRGSTDEEAAGFLYGIARHQLSRYTRRGTVERKAVERLGIRVPVIADDDYDRIIELAGLSEVSQRVAAALSTLSTDERAALELRVIDERPYRDVAARLGVSEQTARARVSRALRELLDAVEMRGVLEATL